MSTLLRGAVLLAALAACRTNSDQGSSPTASPSEPPQEAAPGASAPAARSPSPKRRVAMTKTVLGVSRDGRRAVVKFEPIDDTARSGTFFRSHELPSGKVLETWTEPHLEGLPGETLTDDGRERRSALPAKLTEPGLAADLAKHAAALRGLENEIDPRFAVSPDGARVVFNGGDWLYLADADGKVLRRLSDKASYHPVFSPDGKVLAYTRLSEKLPGHFGNYMVVFASPEDGRESRVERAKDVGTNLLAFSPDGRWVYFTSDHLETGAGATEKGCFVRADVAPPHAVKKLACAPEGHELRDAWVSPGATEGRRRCSCSTSGAMARPGRCPPSSTLRHFRHGGARLVGASFAVNRRGCAPACPVRVPARAAAPVALLPAA